MSRTSRRAALFAAFALSVTPLVSACGAGPDATPRIPYAPADGVEATVGPVKVINALLVRPEGSDQALISMTVANGGTTPDQLVGLSVEGAQVSYSGPTAVPAGGALRIGATPASAATVTGLSAKSGEEVRLTVAMRDAGQVTVSTVVYAATGPYATFTPQAPQPAATPSAVVSSGTPTPAAGAQSGQSATATPSPSAS